MSDHRCWHSKALETEGPGCQPPHWPLSTLQEPFTPSLSVKLCRRGASAFPSKGTEQDLMGSSVSHNH